MTAVNLTALNRLYTERFQGKTGQLEGFGVALFHVEMSIPTVKVEAAEVREACSLDSRPAGLLCLISQAPEAARKLFLVGDPLIFPRQFHSQPVYYALVSPGSILESLLDPE